MGWKSLRRPPAKVSQSTAAIDQGIAVQQFFPESIVQDADEILQPRDRRKVTDDGDALLRRQAVAQEADDGRPQVPFGTIYWIFGQIRYQDSD